MVGIVKKNHDVRIRREYHINQGKIKTSGGNEKPLIADYVLTYKNRMLAVVEALMMKANGELF